MLDRLTIEPPAPPWRVLMRLTASREHSSVPSTLTSSMRLKRAALISSRRAFMSTMPALLTNAVRRPRPRSTASNIATTAASSATSARTSSARRPSARTCAATASAAAALRA